MRIFRSLILLMFVITLAACSVEDTRNDKSDNIKENKVIQTETSKGAVNDPSYRQLNEATLFKLIGTTTEEAIKLLGNDYEGDTSYDALQSGEKDMSFWYDYKDLGICLYGRNETTVGAIDCYGDATIFNAQVGMTIAKIEGLLGKGEEYVLLTLDSEVVQTRDCEYLLVYYFDDVAVGFRGWCDGPTYLPEDKSLTTVAEICSKDYYMDMIEKGKQLYQGLKTDEDAIEAGSDLVSDWEKKGLGDHILAF